MVALEIAVSNIACPIEAPCQLRRKSRCPVMAVGMQSVQ